MAIMEIPQLQPLGLVDIEKAFRAIPQHIGLDDVLALAALAAAVSLYFWIVRERPDPYLYKLYERPQEHMSKGGSKATTDIAEKLGQIVRIE